MPKATAVSRSVIDWTTGKTAMPALPANVFVALFTTAPTANDGTGAVEATGGGYARILTAGATWNAAAGASPASTTNAAVVTFPTLTATCGTVLAFGLYDASTTGNLREWDYLGNFAWLPFSATSATPGVLTVPAHGFSNGDQVVVTAQFGGALPATAGSWAGLLTVANVTTDTFTAGVNTTGSGSGMVRKVLSQSTVTNLVISFAIGTLTLTED